MDAEHPAFGTAADGPEAYGEPEPFGLVGAHMKCAMIRTMCARCLALSALALACLAASFPQYPVKPVRDYPTAEEKAGLVVAALPVADRKEQHTYFGTNLRSRGYLPVLLVIKNETAGESYLLNKEGLMYDANGRSGSIVPSPAKVSGAEEAADAAGAAPTAYTFLAGIAVSRSKKLRQHLLETELHSATLSPGASLHGFIFVPVRGKYPSQHQLRLTVPFIRSGTDEVVTIDLTI